MPIKPIINNKRTEQLLFATYLDIYNFVTNEGLQKNTDLKTSTNNISVSLYREIFERTRTQKQNPCSKTLKAIFNAESKYPLFF